MYTFTMMETLPQDLKALPMGTFKAQSSLGIVNLEMCTNFVFANSVKKYIWDLKNS